MLFSIYQFSIILHLESFPKYQEKNMWLWKIEVGFHENSWNQKVVPDGFLGHDLWERNQKLFSMGFEIL